MTSESEIIQTVIKNLPPRSIPVYSRHDQKSSMQLTCKMEHEDDSESEIIKKYFFNYVTYTLD